MALAALASAVSGTSDLPVASDAQRQHLHALATTMYGYRSQLDYPPGDRRDGRDSYSFHLTEQQALHVLHDGGRLQFDCSEFDAWLLKCSGLWPWSSPGYTGSHLASLPHYSDPRAAFVGALVVFGPGTGHHEAMVYTPDPKGGNPMCVSHGRPGLDIMRLKDIARYQPPGVTMLSIAHL